MEGVEFEKRKVGRGGAGGWIGGDGEERSNSGMTEEKKMGDGKEIAMELCKEHHEEGKGGSIFGGIHADDLDEPFLCFICLYGRPFSPLMYLVISLFQRFGIPMP